MPLNAKRRATFQKKTNSNIVNKSETSTHSMINPFSVDNLRVACRIVVIFYEALIEWRLNRFCVIILFICHFKYSIESVFISHLD